MEDPKHQFVTHIENRRLQDLAARCVKAEEWEQEHLQGCRICARVLYIYLNQSTTGHRKIPNLKAPQLRLGR